MSGDDYVTVKTCEDTSRRILAKLDSIEQRLFKDNGTISIQTRLDRHERIIRVVLWALSVIGGAFLTSLAVSAIFLVKGILTAG